MGVHAFADPVFDAQRVFRAVMNAFARPGTVHALGVKLAPPEGFDADLAALVLALADHETPVWLDPVLRTVAGAEDFVRFYTGAGVTRDASEAVFALVSAPEHLSALECFAQGTAEYPDRSTTIFIHVNTLADGAPLIMSGPGIPGQADLRAGSLPAGFVEAWADNHALFPCGVDLLLVSQGSLLGLPRSTQIKED